ncbi:MAG TPA: GIY-YIG nuclease family protein [bacterium]|nr:GIY-YIG nuclease family protein [bacterium]
MKTVYSVYILRCADGTLYTGIALDVAARVAQHNAGTGARYTRGRGPVRVLVRRRVGSRSEAQRLEAALKRLPCADKVARLRRYRVPAGSQRAEKGLS